MNRREGDQEATIRPLTIGTRGSTLALAQTKQVVERLRAIAPDLRVSTEVIQTTGDRIADAPLATIASSAGGQGVFVKEIEAALLAGRIDVAVHSLKDLPAETPHGLALAAFPGRADPRDALVARRGESFGQLRAGSVVGTSSPRRFAQLRHARPDLTFADLRGNVDTRLRKLAAGRYDAIVLAAAGLERLGRIGEASELLGPEVCLPAVGQGILAVEIRADDPEVARVIARIDEPAARAAARAERSLLRAFGAGCSVPIGALAAVDAAAGILTLDGIVAAPDGSRVIRGRAEGRPDEADALGKALFARLISRGAGDLLSVVRGA